MCDKAGEDVPASHREEGDQPLNPWQGCCAEYFHFQPPWNTPEQRKCSMVYWHHCFCPEHWLKSRLGQSSNKWNIKEIKFLGGYHCCSHFRRKPEGGFPKKFWFSERPPNTRLKLHPAIPTAGLKREQRLQGNCSSQRHFGVIPGQEGNAWFPVAAPSVIPVLLSIPSHWPLPATSTSSGSVHRC